MALAGWSADKKIVLTVSGTDDTLVNFPLTVYLGSSVGKTSYNVTDIFSDLGANKYRMAAEYVASGTECYIEIDNWDYINSKATLYIKVPTCLSGTATTLNLYYDVNHADNNYAAADSYTKLLISSNNYNATTVFTDTSTNARTITTYGAAQHSSTQLKFGISSIKFAAAADYLSVADHADFQFGSTPFTIDFWAYNSDGSYASYRFPMAKINGSYAGWYLSIDQTTGYFRFVTSSNTTIVTSSSAVPRQQWVHLAVTYDGTYVRLFIDGLLKGTSGSIASIQDVAYAVTVGRANATYYFVGYLDEVRISKGTCRWTADFSVPTKPYIALYVGDVGSFMARQVWDSNYTGVWHMSQDPSGTAPQLLDSTTYCNRGTSQGTMTTSDLVAGLNGGKAQDLEGTDDYFSIPDNTSLDFSTAMTLEVLTKFDSSVDNSGLISKGSLGGVSGAYCLCFVSPSAGGNGWDFRLNDSVTENNGRISGGTVVTGTWYYAVAVYDSINQRIEVNNSLIKSYAYTTSVTNNANNLVIGTYYSTAYTYDGLIDEVRVSKVARSAAWRKASYNAIMDTLVTFSVPLRIFFSNASPVTKVYGPSQTLQALITVSGESPPYYYDADFYLSPANTKIGTTISGVLSGNYTSTALATTSGVSYGWYVKATVSGSGFMKTSDIYSFYVRYLCAGTCSLYNAPASGIPVRLYRRSSGYLAGATTSSGAGAFTIDTEYYEQHYAVALPTLAGMEGMNAIIFDSITPV